MKKLVIALCVVMIVLVSTVSFIGCTKDDTQGTQVVTDMIGREVSVPLNPQRIVCIGAGALRLYSYIGDMTKLCGVENVEKADTIYFYHLNDDSFFRKNINEHESNDGRSRTTVVYANGDTDV